MSESGPYTEMVRALVCSECDLRLLGEQTLRAALDSSATPEDVGRAIGALLSGADEFDSFSDNWDDDIDPDDPEFPSPALFELLDDPARDTEEGLPIGTPHDQVVRAYLGCEERRAEGECPLLPPPLPGSIEHVFDRDLGAGVLEQIARHGSAEDAREYLRRTLDAFAPRRRAKRLPDLPVAEWSEDEVREGLFVFAELLRKGKFTPKRRDDE